VSTCALASSFPCTRGRLDLEKRAARVLGILVSCLLIAVWMTWSTLA